MVCQHGWKHAPRNPFNKEIVIDLDDIYVSLGDLAESVRPRNKLYNTVAEIGINIIKRENQNPKKVIIPLRIASYLIEGRDNLKEVTRCFENSPSNRLDHKDIVCFPTLQAFPGTPKDASGHYWLVNLNIKAQRFEIYDSLGNNSEPVNMHACHLLIAGIKTNWTRQYSNSKIKIMDWPIEIIDSPRQNNGYDCGFFTLKNLEACPSRTPATYSQKDIPNIRKLYTDKWLHFTKKANWQLFV
ncbi:putative ubiquitin-like-specific protease 1B [Lolium perenne]|uniref:putative ubiquitin-like-specific protease 1B n=1 Tax=Lolium perenne TaxID=4522 RepID=UPI003A99B9FD